MELAIPPLRHASTWRALNQPQKTTSIYHSKHTTCFTKLILHTKTNIDGILVQYKHTRN